MSRRVVIIGAGAIGLSCAYYAIQRGDHVTLLERLGEHRDGCSFGNAGMVVPSHFVPLAAPGMIALGLRWMANPESPFYIKPRWDRDLFAWAYRFWRACTPRHVSNAAPLLRDLSLMSRQCFVELEQRGLDFDLHQAGLLMLCRTQQGLDHETVAAEHARQLGLTAEVLDAKGLKAVEPDIAMSVVGGVRYPQDCHLTPQRYMAAMQAAVKAAGGHLHWNTDVHNWRHEAGKLVAVRTSQGDFEADEFVLCGGSWSPQIVDALGLRLPMQAGKGYSLTLAQPRQSPNSCAILTEARIAVTPMSGQLRFGGTMELAGLDESINRRRVQGIIRAVSLYYPQFEPCDFESVIPWSGLRPCSPDGLPYLGRSTRYGNLTIATGHAMMGISLAPITGRLVAQLLSHERPDIKLDPLSPDRFG